MSRMKDITGQRFHRLVALEPMFQDKKGQWHWRCACDCGNECVVVGVDLRNGRAHSCGCYAREAVSKREFIHGLSGHSIYRIHRGMMLRCYDPSNKAYKYYGVRGITVCEEWHKFEIFYEWALKNGYEDKLTIERINVNGNYCPENCTWIPKEEQANNKQNSLWFTYNGETKILKHWADDLGQDYHTLYRRVITLGWDIERAFKEVTRAPVMLLTYKGETKPIKQWSRETGIDIYYRIHVGGWTVEEAFTLPPNARPYRKPGRKEDELITFNGKTLSLVGWSEEINIPLKTLKSRLFDKHWSVHRTLTEPMHYNMVR